MDSVDKKSGCLHDIVLDDGPRTHLERFLDTRAAVALNRTSREFRNIPFPYNTVCRKFHLNSHDVVEALVPVKSRFTAFKAVLRLEPYYNDDKIDEQSQFLMSNIKDLDVELHGGSFGRLSGPLASMTGLEKLSILSIIPRSRRSYPLEPLLGKLPIDVSNYKQLKKLRLGSVEVEPATPNPWSQLQGLEELTLHNTTGVSFPGAALADMSRLSYLSIESRDLRNQPLPLGSQLAAVGALPRLTLKAADKPHYVQDDTLDQLAKLPELDYLRLEHYRISMDGAPISGTTQLTELFLNYPCPPIHSQPRRDPRVCAALGFPGLRSISGAGGREGRVLEWTVSVNVDEFGSR
jgi:hypothetical protein